MPSAVDDDGVMPTKDNYTNNTKESPTKEHSKKSDADDTVDQSTTKGPSNNGKIINLTLKLPPPPQKLGLVLRDDLSHTPTRLPVLTALRPNSMFRTMIPTHVINNYWITSVKDEHFGEAQIIDSKSLVDELAKRRKYWVFDGREPTVHLQFTLRSAPSNKEGYSIKNNNKIKTTREIKSFEQRIEDLRLYKEKHGHIHVESREDKSLYKFCKNMRYARKYPGKQLYKLDNDRIAKLDTLGIDWSVNERRAGKKSFEQRTTEPANASGVRKMESEVEVEEVPKQKRTRKSFEQRIEDLRAYKEKHGHTNVRGSEDMSLHDFCGKMRHARNNPGKSDMLINEERIAILDTLGFDWTVTEWQAVKTFEQRITDLRAYKEKNGHVNVKGNEDMSLYNFCKHNRYARNNPEKGQMTLSDDKIASLDALGFTWNSKPNIKSFEQRIDDLRAYKEKHGHMKVKQKEDKSRADFCKRMRQAHKNPGKSRAALSDDRIASMDALGFDWGVRE